MPIDSSPKGSTLDFDETLVERRVAFEITNTAKGPRAANVRPAD